MKRSFVQRMLADYPDWHDRPFLLTSAEIKEPRIALEEFFNRYSLDNLRTELKELMTDALSGGSIDDPTMYIGICTNLEKLAEACYVLYKKEFERTDFLDKDEVTPLVAEVMEGSLPDDMMDTDETWVLSRPALLLEIAHNDPMKGIHRTFQTSELEGLDECMETWCSIALSNEYGAYDHATLRGRLIAYTKEMRRLFEALYALRETEEIKRYTNQDYLSPGLAKDIRDAPEYHFLSIEERENPMEIVNSFFERFTYRYARLELWDLLDAVISYKGEEPTPVNLLNILVEYDCMAALLLAGKLLAVRTEGNSSAIEKSSEDEADGK